MKRRFVNILIIFIAIILILYILNKNQDLDNDISNSPLSKDPKFIKLTREHQSELSATLLSSNDYSKLIDIVDFKFKISPFVCEYSPPLLLIMVHSAPRNFENRKTIRNTWAANSNKTKLLFMLGSIDLDSANADELQNKILEESYYFRDILQGSFIDSYMNLTYKHMMAFKYVIYHCNRIKYILKTDDDVFVNKQYLLKYISSNFSEYGVEKLLMCNLWDNANVRRSFKSKYRVSFEEYSSKTFPPYCSGWFILYSPDVVFSLYQQAQISEYFWIDDVFLTGIVAQKIKISHFNIKNYVISRKTMKKIMNGDCDEKSAQFIMGRPNIHTESILKLWKCVQKYSGMTNY